MSIYLIEMIKNKRGKWFWRLKSRNGKILAVSEDYSSKAKCKHTANNIVKLIER